MNIHAATDWSIIHSQKQPAIFDRCIFEIATKSDMQRLNEKYAFVFPRVLLMECAKAKNPRVIENIERIEHFLVVSLHDRHINAADAIPVATSDIMKKDLGVGVLRKLDKDIHLVYLTPCDKQSQMSLIAWAQINDADAYYKDFNAFEQMFPLRRRRHKNTLEDLIEKTQNDGWREGKGYVPKEDIKRYWQTEIKAHKKHYGYNPFYGTQMEDVIGLAKTSLLQTPIIEMIDILSKVYNFDPSWAKKQIAFRPNYPQPDDYAKYTNYFYFITMCSVFGGLLLDKAYLRDWEYVHYLPFCEIFSADKRFFKRLKEAMKTIGTDQVLGIAIPERIHIWDEGEI